MRQLTGLDAALHSLIASPWDQTVVVLQAGNACPTIALFSFMEHNLRLCLKSEPLRPLQGLFIPSALGSISTYFVVSDYSSHFILSKMVFVFLFTVVVVLG